MADYDVLVIGSGPGGYPAAIRASQLGLKAACVEKEKLGGVCLNWGCIPSKALLTSAEYAIWARHAGDWGLSLGEVGVDYPKVIGRSRDVADRSEKGVKYLFKKHGVTSIEGTAVLTGPGQVSVSGRTVTATHVIVATGGRAKFFPGIEPDGERILTYREAIVSTERPNTVTVIGAGAIGMEFAYFWNGMGCEVTVVEALDEVLPLEDGEAGAAVRKAMAKQGVTFLLGKRVSGVQRDGDGTVTTLEDGTELRADQALVALGVRPNVEDIGLDAVGIRTGSTGIEVDASYRTSATGFYALGDVCSLGPALAHTATRQAHVCVERIAGHDVPDIDYDAMPSCTYCQPQVASVGWTEARCKEQGIAYKVGRFPFSANGKARGSGHTDGFVKVLVGDTHGEMLGAHIVGEAATELISEFVLAKTSESLARTIVTTTHAHPTYSEAMYEAVAEALGEGIHL